MDKADIGVFGGSGFYSFLDVVEEIEVETPYGAPSAPVVVGEVGGRRVAFLPRHGRRHELPPAAVPYRANVWAMRELGVRRIIGPCASGALQPELPLGSFVLCDQFVDRTHGRADTFYPGPETVHVSAADPYCPGLRRILVETARERGVEVVDGGTVVVIQGPRFSTRAESRWFQSDGLGRDQHDCLPRGDARPGARALLREHLDGHRLRRRCRRGHRAVSSETVMRVFAENNERLRDLLFAAIPRIGPQPENDVCATALEGARVSF